jgi:hypothetical protein
MKEGIPSQSTSIVIAVRRDSWSQLHVISQLYARKIPRSYTCDMVQTELKDKLGRIVELKRLGMPALESPPICMARLKMDYRIHVLYVAAIATTENSCKSDIWTQELRLLTRGT